jgi:hypothetical protein
METRPPSTVQHVLKELCQRRELPQRKQPEPNEYVLAAAVLVCQDRIRDARTDAAVL